jgi:hypothetical protein
MGYTGRSGEESSAPVMCVAPNGPEAQQISGATYTHTNLNKLPILVHNSLMKDVAASFTDLQGVDIFKLVR